MKTPGNESTTMKLISTMLFVLLFFCINTPSLSGQQSDIEDKVIATNAFYKEFLTRTGSGTGMELSEEYYQNKEEILEQVKKIEKDLLVDTKKIKVVFHILYTNDFGKAQQSIQFQIEALNRDFSGGSQVFDHPNDPAGNYLKLALPASIEFELASTDRDNQFSKGIVALRNGKSDWSDWEDMKDSAKIGSNTINPSSILNIWICELPENFGSYATKPYYSDQNDGIVLDYRLFDTEELSKHSLNQGKTLTHLVGNYLGLDPLWGSEGYCSDDGIDDTPIHNAPNAGSPKHRHISICRSHLRQPEMVMNFMDSTNDSAQTMFTEGQVRRMHAILLVARPDLFENTIIDPK